MVASDANDGYFVDGNLADHSEKIRILTLSEAVLMTDEFVVCVVVGFTLVHILEAYFCIHRCI